MAFQRYSKFKRTNNAFRKPKMSSTYTLARKAYQMAKKANTNITGERKYVDTDVFMPTIANSALVTHLTGVAEGDDNNQRSGRQIGLKSLSLKADIAQSSAAVAHFRIMIVRCIDDMDATAPTLANLLQDTTNWFNSPLALSNSFKYHMIRDMRFTLDPLKAQSKMLKVFHKFGMEKDRSGNRTIVPKVTYTGSTTTTFDYGPVFAITVSDLAYNSMGGICRIRFIDN